MAGRSDRLILAALLGLILCAAAPTAAEEVHGESRELGVKFRVPGGSAWCAPRVRVELTADSGGAMQAESIPFIQMFGRIRAVILSQCEQTETIEFTGRGDSAAAFVAEMSRLTKWRRLISFDPSSRQPICPPTVPQPQCAAQAEAYRVASQLFAGKIFADTEIVSALDAESNDLTFRSKNLVGKLRIVSRGDFSGKFDLAGQLADAIATDIGGACTAEGGRSERANPLDLSQGLSRRSILCRVSGRPNSQNVVLVWQSGDRFRVFSLLSEKAASEIWPFTNGLVRAI